MLDSVELDGVIIATPHYDHPDMSIAAFQRGINVLVEKPIAVHIGEAQRMIDAYQEREKIITGPGLRRHVYATYLGTLA